MDESIVWPSGLLIETVKGALVHRAWDFLNDDVVAISMIYPSKLLEQVRNVLETSQKCCSFI